MKFSNKWSLEGYGAYGFNDQRFKYEGSVTRILDRNRWTLKIASQKEIDQVGLEMENLAGNSIFLAASRFGTLRKPFISTNHRLEL